jgi:hypothetical protein
VPRYRQLAALSEILDPTVASLLNCLPLPKPGERFGYQASTLRGPPRDEFARLLPHPDDSAGTD